MRGCAALSLLLAIPTAAAAYTVKIDAGPAGDQPSLFRETGLPLSRFEEKLEKSNASISSQASSFGLKNMDSAVRIKTENTLTELGARRDGKRIIVELPGDVLFDFDKSNIRPDARSVLSKLSDVLKAMAKTPVAIIGHTDSKGSDDYNQRLSERRAASVRRWLSDSGVVTSMITQGKGERAPVASNQNNDGSDNPEGRQQNRRVELIIGES